MWKKKLYLRCVFLLTVACFFLAPAASFIERKRKKNCEKQQNGALLWPPFFLIGCTCYRALQCTRIHSPHTQCITQYVNWRQCAGPKKKNEASDILQLMCSIWIVLERGVRIVFISPGQYSIISLSFYRMILLSIHMSLCLLSKISNYGRQILLSIALSLSLYSRLYRVKKRIPFLSYFLWTSKCVFAMRFSLLWLFVVIRCHSFVRSFGDGALVLFLVQISFFLLPRCFFPFFGFFENIIWFAV